MAVDILLKIDGEPIQRMLKGYKVDENLLWADADRAMDGSIHATRIGEFPKIELTFKDGLSQEEIQKIGRLTRNPFFSVEHFKAKKV